MTREENIKAILECYFTGFKDVIIDSACKRICELEQEPILNKIRAEIDEIEINGQIDKYTLFIRSGNGVKNIVLDIIDKYRGKE